MKRRLIIIANFLLLGAVVNVAVAWGCAVKSIWGGYGALKEITKQASQSEACAVEPGGIEPPCRDSRQAASTRVVVNLISAR